MITRTNVILLGIFSAVIIAFALLSNNESGFPVPVAFHDTHEYITVAKELAGIHNVNVHSGHPFIYPAYLSLFVKLVPVMWVIKFANVLWLVGIAALLLLASRNLKAFLIFAFSPLVWWLSPQVTPVLPAAFLFTLAYLSLKTFESKNELKWLAICGAAFGLATSMYLPVVLPASLMLLLFFYNKQFKFAIFTIVCGVIGFLPSLILEYYLFGNPIYSLIRYAGAAFTVSTGITNTIGHSAAGGFATNIGWLLLAALLLITPLLFLFYKIEWKKYWREGVLILLTSIFFVFWAGHWRGIKYFMIFAPVLMLLLATKLSRKQLLACILVSVVLTGFMTYGFFGKGKPDALRAADINEISADGYEKLIAYDGAGTYFSVHLFKQKPFIFWWKEYGAATGNKTTFSNYDYVLDASKVNLLEQFQISASLATKTNDFSDTKFIFERKDNSTRIPLGFRVEKCYRVLCIVVRDDG